MESAASHPFVRSIMAGQSGLITLGQATEAGLTDRDVQRLVRVGEWGRVRRGVYVDADEWSSLDPYRGRPRLLGRAACLLMKGDFVLSHDSAAHELGLGILRVGPAYVHVTRRGARGGRAEQGVMHHRASFAEDQVVLVDGQRVLGPARTVADLARQYGLFAGVVAADQALRHRLATPAQLGAAAAAMAGWRNVTVVREAVRLARPGADTPGESLLRLAVLELGIGEPDCQFPVPVGHSVGFVDLRVGRHLFEFDGRLKYVSRSAGGVADRPVEQVLREERRRQQEICQLGFGMSRVTWAELQPPNRAATVRRLAEEYEVTRARFGVELPAWLVEFAAQQRLAG